MMKLKMKYMKLNNEKKKLNEKILKHKAGKYKYDFQKYETIRSFDESIYAGKISVREAEID